jgi:hypothetical protein
MTHSTGHVTRDLAFEISHVDGVMHIHPAGVIWLQTEIEDWLRANDHRRILPHVIEERLRHGIHPGDRMSVSGKEALIEYRGGVDATVIYREYRNNYPGTPYYAEVRRQDKTLSHNQCIQLFLRAALDAHHAALNASSGVHHAWTGTAYNPTPKI